MNAANTKTIVRPTVGGSLTMFNLKGLYSMITFLILATLTILGAILKLCGVLLLSWLIIALLAIAATTFLILGSKEIW